MIPPFHLAIPVDDLEAARTFYTDVLGCSIGREDTTWIDFNLYGHQVVAHLAPKAPSDAAVNPVDGEQVPVPHFGVVLSMEDWEALSIRLQQAGTDFVIPPTVRFRGKAGEQATLFFRDPSGNALEFKAFQDITKLFATD